jgi:hypothetical protein
MPHILANRLKSVTEKRIAAKDRKKHKKRLAQFKSETIEYRAIAQFLEFGATENEHFLSVEIGAFVHGGPGLLVVYV